MSDLSTSSTTISPKAYSRKAYSRKEAVNMAKKELAKSNYPYMPRRYAVLNRIKYIPPPVMNGYKLSPQTPPKWYWVIDVRKQDTRDPILSLKLQNLHLHEKDMLLIKCYLERSGYSCFILN